LSCKSFKFSSTSNSLLHLPAIAHELGIQLSPDLFDKIHRKIPYLLNIAMAACTMIAFSNACIVMISEGFNSSFASPSACSPALPGSALIPAHLPELKETARKAGEHALGLTCVTLINHELFFRYFFSLVLGAIGTDLF